MKGDESTSPVCGIRLQKGLDSRHQKGLDSRHQKELDSRLQKGLDSRHQKGLDRYRDDVNIHHNSDKNQRKGLEQTHTTSSTSTVCQCLNSFLDRFYI